MRSLKYIFAFAIANAIPLIATADNIVGTVALIEGHAYAQKGEIYFTRPNVGEVVRVNEFGQLKDFKTVPAYVTLKENTRRHLKPNDTIEEGDVIMTNNEGWTKLLFNDDSLLDIGPNGVVQISKFNGFSKNRTVIFKVLKGKFRSVVAQEVTGPNRYQFLTPGVLFGVRGTELLINVSPGDLVSDPTSKTEMTCVHGQVSIDIAKYNKKGLVYYHPSVANPGTSFSADTTHGFSGNEHTTPLSQENLRHEIARMSPLVNVHGTILGSMPNATKLVGTGLPLTGLIAKNSKLRTAPNVVSSFDLESAPMNRRIASPSGNFHIPDDFKKDRYAFGQLPDLRNFTGPAPISQLPGNTARTQVTLSGF